MSQKYVVRDFRFYALTAAAAVLKYVEYIQCVVFARESLKIEYHSSENTMIIGISRIKLIDITRSRIKRVIQTSPFC